LSVRAANQVLVRSQGAAVEGRVIMGKVPEGFHRVRGHIRRNPKPRSAKGLSAWTIAGLVAAFWLWGQVFGPEEATSTTPPAAPKPAVASASAGR
jgi:hypothetical protein